MAALEIIAPEGLPFIDTARRFDAPRDLVFRAYSEPDLVAQWMGPERYETRIDRLDVRDGGTWRYVHRDADGNEWAFHGVFHGPQTVDGMLQTFEFEGAPGHVSLEKLELEPVDGGTMVRTHSVYQSVEARDAMLASGMEEGMTDGYRRLEGVLERLAAPVG